VDEIKYVENRLESINETQKWMWTILVSLALSEATMSLVEVQIRNNLQLLSLDFLSAFGMYVGLLAIIYRFYVGDARILSDYYKSIPRALSDDPESFWKYICKLTPNTILLDGLGRITQYCLIAAASFSLYGGDKYYLHQTLILLFFATNTCFCGLFFFKGKGDNTQINAVIRQANSDYRYYRTVWFFNNLAFFFLLLLAFIYVWSIWVWISLIVINSVIDICFCKKLYIPSYCSFKPENLS